jgi:hypothetical protein
MEVLFLSGSLVISCPLIIGIGPSETVELRRDWRDYPLCGVATFRTSSESITAIHPLFFNVIAFGAFKVIPTNHQIFP